MFVSTCFRRGAALWYITGMIPSFTFAGIILYHIFYISYHIISYHITSFHIISYHIISYIIYHISYHIISYHIISYHIISYHIISYHISYCSHKPGCIVTTNPDRSVLITIITWHFQFRPVNVSILHLKYEYRARRESHFACYSHCYVTWCPLTIPVVKGRCARDALPHAFHIGVFKVVRSISAAIKHIYKNLQTLLKVVMLLLTTMIAGISNKRCQWL